MKKISLLVLAVLTSKLCLAVPAVPEIKPPLETKKLKDAPPVGFLMLVAEGDELYDQGLNDLPATADLSHVFSWKMKSHGDKHEEQIADFTLAETWLRSIYESNRVAWPILDTLSFLWFFG